MEKDSNYDYLKYTTRRQETYNGEEQYLSTKQIYSFCEPKTASLFGRQVLFFSIIRIIRKGPLELCSEETSTSNNEQNQWEYWIVER